MFQRTFSSIEPNEAWIPPLDLGYCKIDQLQDVIDSKVEDIISLADNPPPPTVQFMANQVANHVQVVVDFYEKKTKKNWMPFSAGGNDDKPWEEWVVLIKVTRAKSEIEQINSRIHLAKALEETLMKIAVEAGRFRDHIPPIVSADPFPFVISHRIPVRLDTTWTKMISNFMPSA